LPSGSTRSPGRPVQPSQQVRIGEYGGRASLRSWLATVSARAALNLRRRRDARPHDSLAALARVAVAEDPELRLAKARYAPQLEQALRRALVRLSPRQRVLLRLHHIEGWSIDRLGELYRVGRSTAARWVNAAREELLAATKREIAERLGLSEREVESLLRALQSDLLHVSLGPLLDDERLS